MKRPPGLVITRGTGRLFAAMAGGTRRSCCSRRSPSGRMDRRGRGLGAARRRAARSERYNYME